MADERPSPMVRAFSGMLATAEKMDKIIEDQKDELAGKDAEIAKLYSEHQKLDRLVADQHAEIAKLKTALHGLVSAIANDQTSDNVLRSRVYAEAQQLCSSEQSTPQSFIEAKRERDDGWHK